MSQEQLISTQTLAETLGSDKLRVIDCRFSLADTSAGRHAYLEAHIPGAAYADLNRDLSSEPTDTSGRHPLPDVDDLVSFFASIGIGHDTQVVVYDGGNGAVASRCWWLLNWLGNSNVRLLDGGYDAWTKAEFETESGAVKLSPAVFRADIATGGIITTTELLENLADTAIAGLFDARDAARFRGEVEPLDVVAGHIPGSTNLPLTNSIDSNGRWKSKIELERLWQEALGSDKEKSWTVMCGSGVTACHLALSAVHAGYCMPTVYVGSWSEWIRDSERPIATGDQ